MVYDWGAIAAEQNRATDRKRVARKRKQKFRGKGGRSLGEALAAGEATRQAYVRTFRKRRRKKQSVVAAVGVVGQALKSIVTGPAEAAAITAVPMGGVMGKAAAAGIAAIPGIGRYLGRNVPPGALTRVLQVGGAAALGALAGEGVDFLQNVRRGIGEGQTSAQYFPSTQTTAMEPYTGGAPVTMQQTPLGTLQRGQEFPGGPFVVKTWDTYPGPGVTGGGAWPIFALLSDGRIVVSKPNGSWKVYRPKKNLVISSNPRLRDIRKLDRMHKRVVKMMRSIVPRPSRRK